MPEVYISVLGESIEVSDEGRFELPCREYTAPELKKIAREVNKAFRQSHIDIEE